VTDVNRNTISNGAFFQLSARLLRYTGNTTYLEWAERVYNWTEAIGLIDNMYNVFDGSDDTINCTEIDHHQWTYNVGVMLYGSAVLQNYTNGSDLWAYRTTGFLDATSTFFSPFENASNIMFEATCELDYSCNYDQLSMKAYLIRWMAGTSQMAPYTAARIGQLLRASAQGAAAACTGGQYGNQCGIRWYTGMFDGFLGLGQQMTATEVFYSLLVNETAPPNVLPNVVIGPAPTNLTLEATRPREAPDESETARPLHDRPGGSGNQLEVAIGSILLVAILIGSLAILM
jgi:mannan endo-1,6-alpha-mannosidase